MRNNNKTIYLLLALGIYFVFSLYYYFFNFNGSDLIVNNILLLTLPFVSVIAGFHLVKQYGSNNPHSMSFAYFTLGLASWSVGQFVFSFYDIKSIVVYPSLGDIFCLSAYPLFLYAIILELKCAKLSKNTIYYLKNFFPVFVLGIIIIKVVSFNTYNIENSILQNITNLVYDSIDILLLGIVFLMYFIVRFYKKADKGKLFIPWLTIIIGFSMIILVNYSYRSFMYPIFIKNNLTYLIDLIYIFSFLCINYGLFEMLFVAISGEKKSNNFHSNLSLMNKLYINSYKYVSKNLNFFEINQEVRRIRFMKSFSIVGSMFFIIFGFVNIFIVKNYLEGIPELVIGLFFIVNSIAINYTKNIILARYIVLLLMFSSYVLLLSLGGLARTGAFWVFTFPPVAFILMGKRGGIIWMIYLYLFLGFLMIFQYFHIAKLAFSNAELTMLMAALLLPSSFIFIFESVSEYTSVKIAEKNIKLLESNKQIQKEIHERKTIERTLSQKLKETEKLNILMIGRELRIAELKKELRNKQK